jgi:hypothetical protein
MMKTSTKLRLYNLPQIEILSPEEVIPSQAPRCLNYCVTTYHATTSNHFSGSSGNQTMNVVPWPGALS